MFLAMSCKIEVCDVVLLFFAACQTFCFNAWFDFGALHSCVLLLLHVISYTMHTHKFQEIGGALHGPQAMCICIQMQL
jgi:hypothetical protein